MSRDEEAEFTALVRRQSSFVFRVAYARAVLLMRTMPEDAVQEIFLKLYRNDGWREAENEQAFLARVAWRAAVDRRRAAKTAGPIADAGLALELASLQPGPEQAMVAANQHALVHTIIDALPEELRLPLVLSASEELSSREIAAILGIPEGTVRTRLQRARQILRDRLGALNTRNQSPNPEKQHA